MSRNQLFLQGKTVLITREKSQARDLSETISNHGGVPIEVPLLSFQLPSGQVKTDTVQKIERVNAFDWVVFTSKNGVDFFFKFLQELKIDLSPNVKIAVIGKKTLQVIENYGYKPAFVPPSYVAEAFLPSFLEILESGELVLICKGNLARDYIAKGLREKGFEVEQAIVYDNVQPEGTDALLVRAFRETKVDIVLFTSPSTINNFMDAIHKNHLEEFVQESVIVSIGPVTTKRIEELGLKVSLSPSEFTVQGMMVELEKYFSINS
ncbi:MAG: uroporphyrinogen-III synthase [Bacillales bacterium]|jgi:uroporphyrinogen-III synthase|nr:uroporphyrinogen-III synthase [Bacillales bacterium]